MNNVIRLAGVPRSLERTRQNVSLCNSAATPLADDATLIDW